MSKETRRRGRIRRGASVMQDFCYFCWPQHYPDSVDMEFTLASRDGKRWTARAHGFGELKGGSDSYGNGSILVWDEGIEFIDEMGFTHAGDCI